MKLKYQCKTKIKDDNYWHQQTYWNKLFILFCFIIKCSKQKPIPHDDTRLTMLFYWRGTFKMSILFITITATVYKIISTQLCINFRRGRWHRVDKMLLILYKFKVLLFVVECKDGKFGWNCSQTCNGCIRNDCNHINGVCKNDSICKPGFMYGKYCNQSKLQEF